MKLFEWSILLTVSSHMVLSKTHTLTFLDNHLSMYVRMRMNNIESLFAQIKRSTQMDDCSSDLIDVHTSDEEEDVPVMDTSSYQCSLL